MCPSYSVGPESGPPGHVTGLEREHGGQDGRSGLGQPQGACCSPSATPLPGSPCLRRLPTSLSGQVAGSFLDLLLQNHSDLVAAHLSLILLPQLSRAQPGSTPLFREAPLSCSLEVSTQALGGHCQVEGERQATQHHNPGGAESGRLAQGMNSWLLGSVPVLCWQNRESWALGLLRSPPAVL